MKIGIIGAGRLGVTMGKYLWDAGLTVVGFYNKTKEHAIEAAKFTDTSYFSDLEKLVQASDTLFVATPDGVIAEIWDCIASYDLTGKIVCHFSGSLSSHVFSGIEETGASGCSIHPMYAFSDKFHSYEQFHTACLVAEGEGSARQVMERLFRDLGHTVLTIRAEDKVKYHAAAAMISNDMIALLQTVLQLLEQCGFDGQDSLRLLTPIIHNNVDNMLQAGPKQALTGPIERGDVQTVQKHLQALQGTQADEVYRVLGRVLVDMVKGKYPDRDHTAMEKLF